ncbi:hypothetical protein SDC9_201817 [bioreactor metagenome]|uniref:Uncharacterized protein n=1 Tax=bioreactor metagenome TaxID=1076179 RepID=A0A645IRZ3_9ZZZZ
MAVQRVYDRARHLVFESGISFAGTEMDGLDIEKPAFGTYHRGISQQLGDLFRVQRRGHHEYFKVFAESRARIQAQRKPEVGMYAPLVEFIEYHKSDILKRGIILYHARQDAFGYHFYPGVFPDY